LQAVGDHGGPAVGDEVVPFDDAHVSDRVDDRVVREPHGEVLPIGVGRLGIEVQDVAVPGVVESEKDAAAALTDLEMRKAMRGSEEGRPS
jgi:hypothetical protein